MVNLVARIVTPLACVVALSGCNRAMHGEVLAPERKLNLAVQPATLVAQLRRLSGAHFHATARMRVSVAGAPDAGTQDTITTTTDLWLDKLGSFHLVENNDQNSGREVVRVGSDLAVALRPGKLILRPAQDPEPQRFLEEAVGQPFAAWETASRFMEFVSTSNGGFGFRKAAEPRPAAGETTPLRKWRETIQVQTLTGEARLDASGGLQTFSLSVSYRATRDQTPIEGEIAVNAKVDQAGAVDPVTMPQAETPSLRQRTILEEKALLTGLGGRLPPPVAPKKSTSSRRAGDSSKTKKPSTPTKAAATMKATP